MPNSLWPHGLQPSRLPCPSPSPRLCSDSCPFSQWCQPTISSSSTLFLSCPQSYPALKSFPMIQLFTSRGKSIWALASASVLPMDQSISQFSRSVMSDSLWHHGLQHARPPCPSPTPWVYSNSCPLSWWYILILIPKLYKPGHLPFNITFQIEVFLGNVLIIIAKEK